MVHRSLLAAAVLVSSAAFAQNYDADGDGDVDADDWEAIQPPTPTQEDLEWAQYPGEQPPQQAPTQAQFEVQLAPYGAWYDEPGLGRVWQPAPSEVGADFTPYTTGGQWVATSAGWQFATTYRFGNAPFHYGRWHRSPRFGWVWWPQYQWAPAWVDWRCNSAGNVAWAPQAPPGFTVRFGGGQPGWSFAYGRHHHPRMSSFSWGRYGGWNGGWRGWHGGGGGRRYYRAPAHQASPVYRGGGWGNGNRYRGGGWSDGNRGGGWNNGNRGGGWRGGGRDNRGGGRGRRW